MRGGVSEVMRGWVLKVHDAEALDEVLTNPAREFGRVLGAMRHCQMRANGDWICDFRYAAIIPSPYGCRAFDRLRACFLTQTWPGLRNDTRKPGPKIVQGTL